MALDLIRSDLPALVLTVDGGGRVVTLLTDKTNAQVADMLYTIARQLEDERPMYRA
jgi:hypothetical protein